MNRFAAGFVASFLLNKIAWKIAYSDSNFGSAVLAGVITKFDHDKLMRLQRAINAEVDRRKETV